MSLSFRAKLSGEVKSPGFLVKLFSRDGRELVGTFVEAGKSGEWKEIHWHSREPLAIPPAALQIASISGKGVIWIDDVKLESSTTDPEVPQD